MKLSHCPTHAQVLDAAREEMTESQRFMKASVLQKTKLSAYGHLINWPFVRQRVEEELGDEMLTPVPDTNGKWDPSIHPEKFLVGGKRKTAGYARASALAPEVAGKYVQRRYNSAVGVVGGLDRLVSSYQKQGLAIDYKPAGLPPLRLSHAA